MNSEIGGSSVHIIGLQLSSVVCCCVARNVRKICCNYILVTNTINNIY